MPSPVGHSLTGYLLSKSGHQGNIRKSWKRILLFIVVANLPDLDFLPGLLMGSPNRFHHQFVHSLGFACILGFLFGAYFKMMRGEKFLPNASVFSCIYASHIIMDFFTVDTRYPFGVPLFWPLTNRYFISPISIFLDIHRAASTDKFFASLFGAHNLIASLIEICFFLLILGIIALWKRTRLQLA